MIDEKEKFDWHSAFLWKRLASAFTLIWIAFVIVYTQGQEDHWLSNTIFLVPIVVWAIVLIVFRKRNEETQ